LVTKGKKGEKLIESHTVVPENKWENPDQSRSSRAVKGKVQEWRKVGEKRQVKIIRVLGTEGPLKKRELLTRPEQFENKRVSLWVRVKGYTWVEPKDFRGESREGQS